MNKEISENKALELVLLCKDVSDVFRCQDKTVTAKGKSNPFPRHAFCFVARKKIRRVTLAQIGSFLSGRSHATIIHSVNTASDIMFYDKGFESKITSILERFEKNRAMINNKSYSS